jgi:myo-inositol 2-dehydrogenase/D-chiro-inositol 1-dehydrogenase
MKARGSRRVVGTEREVPVAGASSRRGFLRRAAGLPLLLAGAPNLIPARALGLDGVPAPSNRITIGVIGAGRQTAHANLPGFLRESDAQVVAISDVDAWRLERACARVNAHYTEASGGGTGKGCSAHRDWRELVARDDIDAVMIATPDHWHAIMALEALRAGKDVACEKPLTRSIAEGRAIADAVTRHGRVFRTDSEFRSIRVFHRAAELVRNGKIGTLRRVMTGTPKDPTLGPQPEMPVPPELDYEMWLGPAPAAPYTLKRVHPREDDRGRPGWITIRDYADGMLANWGAHLNDIAMWANDTEHTGPVEVEATGKYPPGENLWNVILEFEARYRFANGVELTCRTQRPFLRLEGDEGWIEIEYPARIEASPASILEWKPGPQDLALPFKTTEKRDFLDAVRSRRQPLYDAEAGHRVAALSHLALASIAVGRSFKWDPVAERAPDDEKVNQALAPRPMRAPWELKRA